MRSQYFVVRGRFNETEKRKKKKVSCSVLRAACSEFSFQQLVSVMREHRAVARSLGLWVRIPPRAVISVSSECCQVEVSASGFSLVQRGLNGGCVSEYESEASTVRRPWPTRGCRSINPLALELDI